MKRATTGKKRSGGKLTVYEIGHDERCKDFTGTPSWSSYAKVAFATFHNHYMGGPQRLPTYLKPYRLNVNRPQKSLSNEDT